MILPVIGTPPPPAAYIDACRDPAAVYDLAGNLDRILQTQYRREGRNPGRPSPDYGARMACAAMVALGERAVARVIARDYGFRIAWR